MNGRGSVGALVVMIGAGLLAGCMDQGGGARQDMGARLEILDLLNSYSHHIDHGLVEEYASLFTDDAVFELHFPGAPTTSFSGSEQIKSLAQGAKERRESGIQRRHLLTNVVFREQTDDSATIACYLLLTSTTDSELTFAFSGQYDGWLVKGENGWKISKWVLTSDSGIVAPASSEEPESEAG